MKTLTIDPTEETKPSPKFWQALGCDHLYQDTRSGVAEYLFDRIKRTGAIRYLRNHFALSDEMQSPAPIINPNREHLPIGGGIYSEDAKGKPIYNFAIMDQVYDKWVSCGIKPVVEMDRIPNLLRAKTGPMPVNDMTKWSNLMSAFAEHLLQRYGEEEVLSWYFECYNEPDRMRGEVHNLLYDNFVAAVERVHPKIRVGGPATFTPAIRPFLEHLDRGTNQVSGGPVRADYISIHRYAMTADEGPNYPLVFPYVGDIVRYVEEYWGHQGTWPQLMDIPLHVNEWGLIGRQAWGVEHLEVMNLRNTEYAALFLAKLVSGLIALENYRPHIGPDRGKTPDLILYWGFAMEVSRGTFHGNRSVLTKGPFLKPIWAGFEMLNMLGDQRLPVQGLRPGDQVSGLATRASDGSLRVMLYNFEEGFERQGSAQSVELRLQSLQGFRFGKVSWYLLDQDHSNTYREWERTGQPKDLTPEQVEELQAYDSPQLAKSDVEVESSEGMVQLKFTLPAQSLSLLVITENQ